MKTILSIVAIFFLTSFISVNAQTKKTETFKVYGNCEMCKKNIETALDIKGVKKAEWSEKTKLLNIEFDSTKTTLEKIHETISNAGYSTDKVNANPKAKKALAKCCQMPDPTKE